MKKRLTGLALAVGLCVPLIAAPASAATPTMYVNNSLPYCSGSGTGTSQQPFCTLGAAMTAVTAGQTVRIGGTYTEALVVSHSGTADQPITLDFAYYGPRAQLISSSPIVVDGVTPIRR